MKIIKQGKLPEEKIIRTTCDKCQTIFEFAVKEAEYISDQRDGDSYKIKCPLCHKEHYISTRVKSYYDDDHDTFASHMYGQ